MFAKITRKHLSLTLFFIKLQIYRLQFFDKKDVDEDAFPRVLRNFQGHFFDRTTSRTTAFVQVFTITPKTADQCGFTLGHRAQVFIRIRIVYKNHYKNIWFSRNFHIECCHELKKHLQKELCCGTSTFKLRRYKSFE